MQTTITTTGRVTEDLELQTSQNGNSTKYVQFSLAVNKGFGEQQHPNYFQCTIFGHEAERIMNAGVKKASLITIVGDLDLVEYTRKSDGSKALTAKIKLYDWSYAPTGKSKEANYETSASANYECEDCGMEGLPFH